MVEGDALGEWEAKEVALFFCRNRVRVAVYLSDSNYKSMDRFEFVSLNCSPMDKVVSVLPHLRGVIAEAWTGKNMIMSF